jgi:hypothetical protein
MKSRADTDFFQESFRQYYPKIVSFQRHSSGRQECQQERYVLYADGLFYVLSYGFLVIFDGLSLYGGKQVVGHSACAEAEQLRNEPFRAEDALHYAVEE